MTFCTDGLYCYIYSRLRELELNKVRKTHFDTLLIVTVTFFMTHLIITITSFMALLIATITSFMTLLTKREL